MLNLHICFFMSKPALGHMCSNDVMLMRTSKKLFEFFLYSVNDNAKPSFIAVKMIAVLLFPKVYGSNIILLCSVPFIFFKSAFLFVYFVKTGSKPAIFDGKISGKL